MSHTSLTVSYLTRCLVSHSLSLNCLFLVSLDVSSLAFAGELVYHLIGIRHFCMLITNFYGEVPPGIESYTFVSFIMFFRVLVPAWAELCPIRAAVSTVPLWLAFIGQPHANLVFQYRLCGLGIFFAWLACVIYQNNREMFVTQVV